MTNFGSYKVKKDIAVTDELDSGEKAAKTTKSKSPISVTQADKTDYHVSSKISQYSNNVPYVSTKIKAVVH